MQVRRRRAEEAAEPEQVPSEREAVAQRRRGKMGQMCCEYKKSVYSEQLEQERFAKKKKKKILPSMNVILSSYKMRLCQLHVMQKRKCLNDLLY